MTRLSTSGLPLASVDISRGRAPQSADLSGVRDFLVLDILNEANRLEATGRSVIHMEAGQPSQGAPLVALEAAEAALKSVRIGYTEACGRPDLRQAISAHYRDNYQTKVSPDEVIVTTGSSAGFSLAFLSLAGRYRRMAFPVPGYPAYRSIASAYGIDVVNLPAHAGNNWMPNPDDIARLHREKGLDAILIASPNNPTGKMIDPDVMEGIISVCEREGIWIIADEIYHGLTFTGHHETLFGRTDNAVVINSFSKYYGMTGWRIGWMVAQQHLLRKMERLAQHLFISPPTLSQIAATAALGARVELDERVRQYQENRDILIAGLKKAGLERIAPVDGAFYAYVDISAYSNDSMAFARKLLNDTGVATTPGLDFDAVDGGRFLRLSFAESKGKIEEAVTRIGQWMSNPPAD